MKRHSLIRRVLLAIRHYLIFFGIVAFVITCCTMLFVNIISAEAGFELTRENLTGAAKVTFINVALISLIFTVIDTVRRKLTVERPVKRITAAAERMVKGDFSVRITQINRFGVDENFNEIIHCFNKMAEELGSVETLRTDFISNVSHEMKTPLAIMQNYGTLLQAPDLPDEKRIEYAKGITEASHRTADMVSNILKLNRLENQQIFPPLKEFDLSEQICACLLQFEELWEAKNINIETDIEEGVIIRSDEELLSHVWSNLFSNAMKFTDEGGLVSIKLASSEHHITLSVSDSGCGMTPEVGARIFDKFYQGDTSHATKGNGLGLALVKRVVDILKGEITVESELGKGSTFAVRLRRNIQ